MCACRTLIFLVMGQSSAMCNNGSGIFSVIMAEFISPLSMQEYIPVGKECSLF